MDTEAKHPGGRRGRRARLLLAALLTALLAAAPLPAHALEADALAEVVSDTWVLMDAGTGQLLAARQPDKAKYPASITKILTVALALRYGSLEDTITVTQTAVDLVAGAAHIALQPGEEITVRDAVMGALLPSANDCANCLAEYVSGSQAAFADLMNQTAQLIGCTGTHFTNASGLPDDDHYTTARDMALITAWALQVPGFREVFSTDYYTMPATNLQPEARSWGTQNAMFVTSTFQVEGAWGGKLGWTEEAHHTMVTALTRQGRDLVLVTMDSTHKDQKYYDGALIVQQCTERLTPLPLTGEMAGAAGAPVYSGEELLGEVDFPLEDVAVWVPAGATAAAVHTRWQLPERLEAGDDTAASLIVSLPGADAVGCLPETELTLRVPQGDLGPVQTAWRSLQAAQDGTDAWHTVARDGASARRWRTVGWVCLALAVPVCTVWGIRWYHLLRRRIRRAAARRRARAGSAPAYGGRPRPPR